MICSTNFKSFFATSLISTFDIQPVIEFEDYPVNIKFLIIIYGFV